MSDSRDDLLAKADSLIRRHRVFVAGARAKPEPDEDLPVLTDVIDRAPEGSDAHAEVPSPPAEPDPALLAKAIASEVDARLAEMHPRIVAVVREWIDSALPEIVSREVELLRGQVTRAVAEHATRQLDAAIADLVESARQSREASPRD